MVARKITGEENCYAWSNSMQLSLTSRKKLGFVHGTIKNPAVSSGSTVNGLVLSWIINSIIPEIGVSIMHAGSAREAWQELEERYRH